MRKKLKNQKGFTTVELLVVCLLLILFTAILALGTGLVANTLRESVAYSEAQTLDGLLTNAISDQIRFQGRLYIYASSEKHKVYVKDPSTNTTSLLLSYGAYPSGVEVKSLKIYDSETGKNMTKKALKPTMGKIYRVELVIQDERGELSNSTFEVKCHYGSVT